MADVLPDTLIGLSVVFRNADAVRHGAAACVIRVIGPRHVARRFSPHLAVRGPTILA